MQSLSFNMQSNNHDSKVSQKLESQQSKKGWKFQTKLDSREVLVTQIFL